ncbi:hypothetical protein GCM10023196_046420 [Actinoallomurus vinaceus]|uniref:Uncharacterized protein n=1 Tax=Actinoallomurus vinaceus TaxID=1080074 RepID=A0ABP8UEP4_9ACTN
MLTVRGVVRGYRSEHEGSARRASGMRFTPSLRASGAEYLGQVAVVEAAFGIETVA